ncbi:MAG TPA: alpha-2-macroglobulin family protein, partial [Bacteroidia bacterium]|nr:alpha-2-macroglobulin family protein [Bacteroidia bacterium]
LRAFFTTKVFEEGGDFSIDRYSIPYSPYASYVGLEVPKGEGYGGMLDAGKTHYIDVATVSSDGKPLSRSKIGLKIYNIEWRWWWDHSDNDVASYLARSSTVPVLDSAISTQDGRGRFRFNLWTQGYGRYLVLLTDPVSGHSAGKVVYVDWPWWARGHVKENENATMLSFSSDKEKYETGETLKLTIPSSAGGHALVCIESGTRVLKKFWVPTTKAETRFEFTVTPDMAPNCYLHVALMQPHSKTTNDLPIRLYGVIPVQVDNPASHILPVIHMPDVLKPESIALIHVKEEKGKAMAYTLALVDEGLLDLTRFKTPDPWKAFNAKEALGVKTWDLYDLVMGANSGKMDKMLSIGGDGDGMGRKGTKANRFKPVVRFVGPFYLNPGQQAVHKIAIPNYVGSVRVMVVAGEGGAYGTAEKTVPVRKPLMILATLPRVLGPGETVSLPVDVFAMEKQVQDVNVEVQSNDLLVLETPARMNMHFKETGDEVLNFRFKVAEKTGIAKVKIIATSGKERTEQDIELDVRTPNPPVSDVQEMLVGSEKTWSPAIAYRGIKGTNSVTLEVSSMPSINLSNRLSYLLEYPHGCIEQTTSSVFPQLLVGNLMELKTEDKARVSVNVKAGLRRLQLFQTANGGFSYWPFQTDDSEWGTNYAGHFMLEAEKRGYDLPHGMKTRWTRYQQNTARQWMNENNRGYESDELIQAYRLYTLALAGSAETGAMNRLREEKNLSLSARWRLAAAYQLVGQTETAKELIRSASLFITPYAELSYSYGSAIRDEAMILETLCLMNEKTKAAQLAITVAKALNGNQWMNTQETAYSLLAMCRFSGASSSGGILKFSYSVNGGPAIPHSSTSSLCQLKLPEETFTGKGKVQIMNEGVGILYAKVVVRGIPLQGEESAASSHLALEVNYTSLKGEPIQPDKLVQGTDFVAEVKITNPGTRGALKEMALNQIFPSGWEIHNSRMDENVSARVSAVPTYQDIRDDRVYSYYNLDAGQSKTFRVLLNATYLGRFYLPTTSSEAMYDNSIHARIPGRWVEVVKETGSVAKK